MIEIQHDLFHALVAVLHGSRTEPNLLLLVYYSSSTRRRKKKIRFKIFHLLLHLKVLHFNLAYCSSFEK